MRKPVARLLDRIDLGITAADLGKRVPVETRISVVLVDEADGTVVVVRANLREEILNLNALDVGAVGPKL